MKKLSKSCSFLSKGVNGMLNVRALLIFAISFFNVCFKAQPVANYVSNGGFEECINCNKYAPFLQSKYWSSIDTNKYFGVLLTAHLPSMSVPLSGYTFQWPRHGANEFIFTTYNPPGNTRGYPRNRLKTTLIKGQTYCVKFYCSISNQSSYGSDGVAAYFADSLLDTITNCTKALTYITPQTQNPANNIIVDTLSWVPITGTFVSAGVEKYMVIGNFKNDQSTNAIQINPTNLPSLFSEIVIDDVSCIDIDLPAYAGIDKSIKLGDSAFIGRQPDVGIDEACVWYQLPGATPIATVAGLYVKPVVTSTYVVKQQIWCGSLKYDTVVVYMNLAGINELSELSNNLKIYPVPASDKFILSCTKEGSFKEFTRLTILNSIGQIVREEEIELRNRQVTIDTSDLPEGVYTITLSNYRNEKIIKKLLVAK